MPYTSPAYRLPSLDEPSNHLYARSQQQMEALPLITAVTDSTGQTLTTSFATVGSLTAMMGIPGNAYLRISACLDLQTDTASGGVVAQLFSAAPGSTYSVHAQTTAQIVLVNGASGLIRATLARTWTITTPVAGPWSFQVRARAVTAATTAAVVGHNSLCVEAL